MPAFSTANAASVALIANGRVLLIRRARAPYRGLWTLPGGRVEPGETPAEAGIREIGEELGLACHHLVPVRQMRIDVQFELQVFATNTFEGTLVASEEIADHCWATAADLGALDTTPELGAVVGAAFRLFERREMR